MSDKITETQAMLAKHHRDGERFAELMKTTFADRFDEIFWREWDRWMTPVYADEPVVLDLGAGPGLFVKAIAERTPGIRAIGVECAPYMLDAAVPMPDGAKMIAEDLHDPKLPLPDGTVDAVMASVVIHEMHQPVMALREVARVLKPGGRLFIADWVRAPLEVYIRNQTDEAKVFAPDTGVEELEDLFIHFIEHNRFTLGDLVYLLNHTGFAVLHTSLSKEGRYARLVAERRAD